MKWGWSTIDGVKIPVCALHTIIAGSGTAGLNAADCLFERGIHDIAIVTEKLKFGTSRNTGSDKQTFYKLSLSGKEGDSVVAMAETLFDGGAMHGDTALVEAALSLKNFYKLVALGVPFPNNEYGEYCGYKTDHDPCSRATSAGPLTSKYMTEQLEKAVLAKGIPILEDFLIVGILKAEDGTCAGLAAVNLRETAAEHRGFTVFSAANTVYAVGGPGDIYETSVYPLSQTGGTGIAMLAGVNGCNLPESQYGIASTGFRWNLSGSFQQVLPRYFSSKPDGSDEKEFLEPYFESPEKLLTAIFLKGYEWPFDPRKVRGGSSLIDLLVYRERQKGRKVFLDFRRNPSAALGPNREFDPSLLEPVVRDYLEQSRSLLEAPIERLASMNPPAIELYKSHGYDLNAVPIEVAVCAQHNNGGLEADVWWESNIKHFFPIGEVAGTFGVYRPGGTALNATQTGGQRAAERIEAYGKDLVPCMPASSEMKAIFRLCQGQIGSSGADASELNALFKEAIRTMSACGAHIRSEQLSDEGLETALRIFQRIARGELACDAQLLPKALKLRNTVLTQICILGAIGDRIRAGGKSRGSYLIMKKDGIIPASSLDEFAFVLDDEKADTVWITELLSENGFLRTKSYGKPVRSIPEPDRWFETVWAKYRKRIQDGVERS